MFLNALLNSEILVKFHQKCGFFKYLTFNLVCLSQKWCILTKIHYIGTYMLCSKEKATFGPIFDQVLQALINTLGPQCTICFYLSLGLFQLTKVILHSSSLYFLMVPYFDSINQFSYMIYVRNMSRYTCTAYSACII